jgi:4-hydroxybenzoate polyprenyltransferase
MKEQIPLCINPEGTVFITNVFLECSLQSLTQKPLSLQRLLTRPMHGKTAPGQEPAAQRVPGFASLPVNHDFLSFLKQEHDHGRKLVLVTAAGMETAQAMAKPFGLFDGVIAGNGGRTKANVAALLQERFGAKEYDYACSGGSDLEARKAARKVILVTGANNFVPGAQTGDGVERIFQAPVTHWGDWIRALRVHQWAKNLLLLAPLVFAHDWSDTAKMFHLLLALAAFCLCASSVYILNDLLDLESDRHHPRKRNRPFAAGKIPLEFGFIGAPLLLLASFLMALALPVSFLLSFVLYYLLTLSYSLGLKQVAILDVLILAGLYSLRVIAGGLAAQVPVTDWLLAFSMFLFMSLAFVKRFTELQMTRHANEAAVKGRGYFANDVELISSMGVACGYLSVLVLAFYINNTAVAQLYRRPAALWLACPVLLYWISRIWLLAHRKQMHDDPIVFTLTDRQSWLIGLIFLLIAAAASPA